MSRESRKSRILRNGLRPHPGVPDIPGAMRLEGGIEKVSFWENAYQYIFAT